MEREFKGSSAFPVSTKKRCVSIDNLRVEIIVNEFSNKRFLIVTCIDKIGTLVEITKEEYKVMMGNRDDIRIDVISRHLQSIIPDLSNKPLTLSIGLCNEGKTPPSFIKKLLHLLDLLEI